MVIYIIIGITVLLSMQGFNNPQFFNQNLFQPQAILQQKDWKRMIMSGFLHVGWMHLIFNMYALYSFAGVLLYFFTEWEFLLVYFGSMLVGNFLSLYMNRDDPNYSAVGASGAVSGVVYASIILNPGGEIGLIFLPGLSIPSWIFGLLFIGYSIYGIRSSRDNIGHEAHLGGAIGGLLITIIWFYDSPHIDWWVVGALLIPTLIFLYLLIYKPSVVLPTKEKFTVQMPQKFKGEKPPLSPDRQRELDRLLEKVNQQGMEGLSMAEKQRLEDLRKYIK